MKKLEVLFVFIGFAIVLASLTIPLWWDRAQPYIFGLPGYIHDVMSNLDNMIRHLLIEIQKNI
ncbi:MAG: hypothetical protein O8C66_03615 [Candidatus Methanoperedens sp.]|nr:hypothetical protein [Candidatus Methanoperedens sp.]MCZ7369574.1 hypothetical protein [Candidatus Methanoperedens sp.]